MQSDHIFYYGSKLIIFKKSKTFLDLTCINTNLRIIAIVCSQARYVGSGTCSESLPPLGKSYASLGKGLGENHLVTSGVAWHLISHTGVAQ